ncbi:T9SS type A sorting domain-containing protein, partial [candidate division WOR-3 bacterium]|nr:T9SS type A sorting domain-containing protein [candidate division WOR-3 bacterium]
NGDTLWTRIYTGEEWADGRSVQLTTDGGYIIAGAHASLATGADVFLIKTDANGDTLWTRTYGGPWDEYGNYVQQTNDGGFIVAGYAMSSGPTGFDFYIVRTDANGNELWSRTYGGQESDFGYWIEQTSDNGYIVVGQTGSFGAGNDDIWLLKIAPEPGVEETAGGVIPAAHVLSESYPNPFRTETQISYQLSRPGFVTVAIYDVSGQRITTLVDEHRDAGYHAVRWDGRGQDGRSVANGVYFCRIAVGEYTSAEKLLLMR